MKSQDILKLSPSDIVQQQKVLKQVIDQQSFSALKEALVSTINDSSKQALGVSLFEQLEPVYVQIDATPMQDIAMTVLNLLTSKNISAFNRAEYKIRGQLADIYININGDFENGLKFLIEADQQADRLRKDLDIPERKELEYEMICSIINYFFENDKSEYCRDWIKRLGEIGQYIQEFEQTIQSQEQKQKYEKILQKLKVSRTNYLYFKGNEEDSKKNFLRAAKLYMAFVKELSSSSNNPEIKNSIIKALDSSIICAVLGEAGSLRSNIIAQISQDKNIDSATHKEILFKTHQHRLITEQDKQKLIEQLAPHQKSEDNTYELSQQFTIYEKAITEHNIVSCTHLYETISLASLAQKLLINEQDTEIILQTMINKGNLKAKIDQTTNFITFLKGNYLNNTFNAKQNLQQIDEQIPIDFNDRIMDFCGQINDYLEQIQRQN